MIWEKIYFPEFTICWFPANYNFKNSQKIKSS